MEPHFICSMTLVFCSSRMMSPALACLPLWTTHMDCLLQVDIENRLPASCWGHWRWMSSWEQPVTWLWNSGNSMGPAQNSSSQAVASDFAWTFAITLSQSHLFQWPLWRSLHKQPVWPSSSSTSLPCLGFSFTWNHPCLTIQTSCYPNCICSLLSPELLWMCPMTCLK